MEPLIYKCVQSEKGTFLCTYFFYTPIASLQKFELSLYTISIFLYFIIYTFLICTISLHIIITIKCIEYIGSKFFNNLWNIAYSLHFLLIICKFLLAHSSFQLCKILQPLYKRFAHIVSISFANYLHILCNNLCTLYVHSLHLCHSSTV